MHDRAIRSRLLRALDGSLEERRPVDPKRLPRRVRALADRRFLDELTPAAVLIAVIDEPVRLRLILTERAADMRDHAGQISFPGGRCDQGDADELATALREAREEVNVDPAGVMPIGKLSEYPTITGFRVTPIVALVDPAACRHLRPNPGEVQQIIQLPLRHVLHLQHFNRGWIQRGKLRLPYRCVVWRGQRIWGATAAMLYELALCLRDNR